MRKTNRSRSIAALIFGVFLMASPFSYFSHAQIKQNAREKGEQKQPESEVQAEIAKSEIGTRLVKIISARHRDCIITKAAYIPRSSLSPSSSQFSMLMDKHGFLFGVEVAEFASPEEAEQNFDGPRSYGAIVPYKGYGDRTVKLFGSARLIAILFRKGNYFVSVRCRNEKMAKELASYTLLAVAGAKEDR